MKKIWFLVGLVVCLLCMPLTGFAKTGDDEAKQKYEDAITDSWKEMMKQSIALDTISAENKASLLAWKDEKNPPEEARKLVDKIEKLQETQEKEQESLTPYTEATKACDEKLNADGANAALENMVRILKDQISDQEEVKAIWKQVGKLLK